MTYFELVVFNLLPLAALAIGISYSMYVVYKTRDPRLVVFTVLLLMVAAAELFELMPYFEIRKPALYSQSELAAEAFESVIHIFAAFSVFYISSLFRKNRSTRQRLVEKQRELDQYRQVFQKADIPTVIADNDDKIVEVNDTFVEESGYSRSEVVGSQPRYLLPEDRLPEVREELRRNNLWCGEIETSTKDGRKRYYRGSVVTITRNGEKMGYAGFFVDLTKRKNYAETLTVLNRVLRHDLRNDMTVVIGYIDSVMEKLEDPELRDYLITARDTADQLVQKGDTARLIEDLLSESLDSEGRSIDLCDVLRKEVYSAGERYPEASFNLDPDSCPEVLGNSLLSDVFEIVIGNSVEHNEDADVNVEVSVEENNSGVVVSIADNGVGIPDERKDSIFGREEIDQLTHGQGLELFFVNKMVETFGGRVWVEDNDPSGSVFKIELEKTEA